MPKKNPTMDLGIFPIEAVQKILFDWILDTHASKFLKNVDTQNEKF